MKEIWKPVMEYDGIYEVSNYGTVRSLPRKVPHRYGTGVRLMTKIKLLKPWEARSKTSPRWMVSLCKDGKPCRFSVGCLVLTAFVGPRPLGMDVCHFPDKNTHNNRLDNVRWDTRKNNRNDCVFHGTQNWGERNGQSKITEEDVKTIRMLYKSGGHLMRDLARRYSISTPTIHAIVHRRTWKHVN